MKFCWDYLYVRLSFWIYMEIGIFDWVLVWWGVGLYFGCYY